MKRTTGQRPPIQVATSYLAELEHFCESFNSIAESLATIAKSLATSADEMQLTRQTVEQFTGALLRLEKRLQEKGGDPE